MTQTNEQVYRFISQVLAAGMSVAKIITTEDQELQREALRETRRHLAEASATLSMIHIGIEDPRNLEDDDGA